jgi:hypothetical protein
MIKYGEAFKNQQRVEGNTQMEYVDAIAAKNDIKHIS